MARGQGVVRGLSAEDVFARYVLHCLYGGFPEGTVWTPDPSNARACAAEVTRDTCDQEWPLRFSWRAPGPSDDLPLARAKGGLAASFEGEGRATELATEAMKTGRGILELVREKKLLKEDEIERIFDPAAMTGQRRPA